MKIQFFSLTLGFKTERVIYTFFLLSTLDYFMSSKKNATFEEDVFPLSHLKLRSHEQHPRVSQIKKESSRSFDMFDSRPFILFGVQTNSGSPPSSTYRKQEESDSSSSDSDDSDADNFGV